jgi:hypothetical protein
MIGVNANISTVNFSPEQYPWKILGIFANTIVGDYPGLSDQVAPLFGSNEMAAIANGSNRSSTPSQEHLTPRELRASCAADRQGLILRKLGVSRSGDNSPCRYELVYARFNNLVANDLELDALEAWLNIGPATTD